MLEAGLEAVLLKLVGLAVLLEAGLAGGWSCGLAGSWMCLLAGTGLCAKNNGVSPLFQHLTPHNGAVGLINLKRFDDHTMPKVILFCELISILK